MSLKNQVHHLFTGTSLMLDARLQFPLQGYPLVTKNNLTKKSWETNPGQETLNCGQPRLQKKRVNASVNAQLPTGSFNQSA